MDNIKNIALAGTTVLALIFGGSEAVSQLDGGDSVCPSGWKYSEATEGDAVHRACYKEPWSVVLNPDNSCNYGLNTTNPNAIPAQCSEVPGWAGR